ncbi:MAG: DUF2029 domain-containing protein [Anaerolineales bacterium]|nr:DUF2029 domain-containing protein [Anaerolineales bacterium]
MRKKIKPTMKKQPTPTRLAVTVWSFLTGLVFLNLLSLYAWKGPDVFKIVLQRGPYSDLSLTLCSASLTWLLVGLFVFLLHFGRIDKENAFSWGGLFTIGLLYLNILRERPEYGDVEYYIRAAQNLFNGLPLPKTYVYPPLWASLFQLLVPLGEDFIFVFSWLLNILSLLAFFLLLERILRLYGFSPRPAALITTGFMLINAPILRTLVYVQVNLHLANLILAGLLLYRKQPFWSALMLALAIHLKASPLILVFAFLLDRNWRWLLWLSLNLVLVGLLSMAISGVSPYLDFINNARAMASTHSLNFREYSLDALFYTLGTFFKLDPGLMGIFAIISKIFLGLATLYITRLNTRYKTFFQGPGENLFNAMPSLLVLMTLTSPLIWVHHGVFLCLPFLVLMKKLESPAEWSWFSFAYMMVYMMPVFDLFPWAHLRLLAVLISLTLIWLLAKKETLTPFVKYASRSTFSS